MQMLTALAAAPDTPMPTMTVDPQVVTPGLPGFLAIAVVAIAVVLLLLDMLRRIRRGRYRAEVREELDAEERARAAEQDAAAEGAAATEQRAEGAAATEQRAEESDRPE